MSNKVDERLVMTEARLERLEVLFVRLYDREYIGGAIHELRNELYQRNLDHSDVESMLQRIERIEQALGEDTKPSGN